MIDEENQDKMAQQETPSKGKRRLVPREEKVKAEFDPHSMSLDPSSKDDDTYDEPPKGKFGLRSDLLMQIGMTLIISIAVVFVMTNFLGMGVSKSAYQKDITRLENDLVVVRGTGYQSGKGQDLASLATSLSSMNSRLGTFLVQGNLDTYATKSEVVSQINTVKTGIPSIDALTSQVNAKLALVDAKLALLGNSTYVSRADLDAAIAYLQSLMIQGGLLTTYNVVGAGATYTFLVGPATAGNYTGAELTLVFPISPATLSTSIGATQFMMSAATPSYGMTYTTTLSGGLNYITGVRIVCTGAGITTPGGTYWSVPAPNLNLLGTPTTVVAKVKT